MLILSCEDQIMKRGKRKQLENKTKLVTNIAMYGGSIALVGLGVISVGVVVNCVIIGVASKVAKVVIRKTGVLELIKNKKVVAKC